MKKIVIGIVLLVIIAVVYFLATSSEKLSFTPKPTPTPVSKKLTKLKIGILPVSSLLQYFVAKEMGYFTQEGLDVEAVTMKGGSSVAPAVASGSLDIGWSSLGATIMGYDGGFDFQYIIGGAYKRTKSDFQEFLVAKDSPIKTPKDLEGKKFAINSPGEAMDLLLGEWTKKNKVDLKKITIVNVPFPQMEAALKNKQIDAAIFNEPYLTVALGNGTAQVLDSDPYNVISERLFISSWFANKSWIENNPEKVEAFRKAIARATEYINTNPDKLEGIIAKNLEIDRAVIGKLNLPVFDAEIKKGDIQVMIDGFRDYGFIKKGFSEQDLVSFTIN